MNELFENFVVISFCIFKIIKMIYFCIFLSEYFVNSKFCCTFAAENIPRVGIMDWGVPGWKGLSVRTILFYVFGIIFMPTCFIFSV